MSTRIILPNSGEMVETPTTQTAVVVSAPMAAAASVVSDGFQSATSAGKSVTNLDTDKLINLDRYENEKKAAKNPRRAIKKLRTSGGSPRE